MNEPEVPIDEFEMRRRAAAVLEVLGGVKTPAEAAEALSFSLARYYLLEARALEGLVAACEPRTRGRGGGEARSMNALRRQNDRLRQELSRAQALVRAVQRATGMPETVEITGRRRRRPQARALRAAQRIAPPPAVVEPPQI